MIGLELLKPVWNVANLALNVRHVYRFGLLWVWPLNVHGQEVRLEDVSPHELRVEITIPAGFSGLGPSANPRTKKMSRLFGEHRRSGAPASSYILPIDRSELMADDEAIDPWVKKHVFERRR